MKIEKFLNASPLYNLSIAYGEIIGGFQKRLAEEQVHFLQALILTGVYFEERPARPSELARVFACSRSTLSHALKGLERKGFLQRNSSSDDARAYFFSLTKEGKRKVPRLVKIFDYTEDRIEEAFAGRKINPGLRQFREIYRDIESKRKG